MKETVSIGSVSFAAPFLGVFLFVLFLGGWDIRAAQIAGVALSTTSVAVVYAVMVETGLNETELGKIILAACFVTDLGTVLMLGALFANFNVWLLLFAAVTLPALVAFPRASRWFFSAFRGRSSEPEIRLL